MVYRGEFIAKPRMTQSDKWKKRPVVTRYFAFKDNIRTQANRQSFQLGEDVEVTFYIPMPKSFTKKKKKEYNGKPHQQRPDIDNLFKSIADCLCKEDSFIHTIKAKKIWSEEPYIEIKNNGE